VTLGNAAAARVRLIVWCKDCQHQVEPDPAEMAVRYGVETTVPDWRYVANMLGEDEDPLSELSIDMFPKDGCLRVYGVGEDGVTAFTRDGIECLQQIIADERAVRRAPPQVKPTE
jgi:hypothetical protein